MLLFNETRKHNLLYVVELALEVCSKDSILAYIALIND
jgi:hypothetical protein